MRSIREELFEKQDLKYKEFHSSLCPNVDKIIGIRVPQLRKMAKEIAMTNHKDFLENAHDEYSRHSEAIHRCGTYTEPKANHRLSMV